MGLRPQLDDLIELRHQAYTLGLASHHLVNSTFTGLYSSVFRGTGLDFEEAREYREGDDIRNMDWKVTARTNVPHLKVFREERERDVVLCVDNGPHMDFGTRGTFKAVQAAHAAALLGWAANRHHDRVGGLVFPVADRPGGHYFRPERGRRSLWRLLHTLSEEVPRVEVSEDQISQSLRMLDRGISTGALVFIIADFNRDIGGLDIPLGQLCQRHTVVLLPVDDPVEKELPPVGRVLFSGPDGTTVEVDTDDDAGRAAYTRAWEERREALVRMVRKLGIILLPLATNEDVHRTLTLGLSHRSAQGGAI